MATKTKKTAPKKPQATLEQLLAPHSPAIRKLALALAKRIREVLPDAEEEIDLTSRMLVFTFTPGKYKGAIVGVALQKDYVNIMFARGVELLKVDKKGLLEGTGKLARHIKIRSPEQVDDPAVYALVKEAAARTPRAD
jgi:hypothetical protein